MTCQALDNGATLVTFPGDGAVTPIVAQSQNFSLQWIARAGTTAFASATEVIVVLAAGEAQLVGPRGSTNLSGPAVAIVPAGSHSLVLVGDGPAAVIATDRTDLAGTDALNLPVAADRRIARIDGGFTRTAPLVAPQVIAIAELAPPPGNGRLRFVQSETISINFVLYEGARGSDALSPHAHDDIEQGSLAILGDYIHHLRTPWGRDAADWRDDIHLPAGPGTLLLIPPELIHTTQGVGDGQHMLIDVFAPPRRDFIAKGWVANAADYADAGI